MPAYAYAKPEIHLGRWGHSDSSRKESEAGLKAPTVMCDHDPVLENNQGWTEDWVVNSMCCSSGEPGFDSPHPSQVAHNCLYLQFLESGHLRYPHPHTLKHIEKAA